MSNIKFNPLTAKFDDVGVSDTGVTNINDVELRQTLTDATTSFLLNLTATGVDATQRNGLGVTLGGTYAGTSETNGMFFDNTCTGRNAVYTNDTALFGYRPGGDRGCGGYTRGNSVGIKTGVLGIGGNSSTENYGVWGSSTINRSGAQNIGVLGAAQNTAGDAFAGAFVLGSRASQPVTRADNAALLCDNSSSTDDIFVAQDNGSDVFVITDRGLHEADSTLADITSVTNSFDYTTNISLTSSNARQHRGASYGITYSGTQDLTDTTGGMIAAIYQVTWDGESGAVLTRGVGHFVNVNNIDDGEITTGVGAVYSHIKAAGTYTNYYGIQFLETSGFSADNIYAFDFTGAFVENGYSVRAADDQSLRYMPLSDANTGITWGQALTIATTSGDLTLDVDPADQIVVTAGAPDATHPRIVSSINDQTGWYFGNPSDLFGIMISGTVRFTVQPTLVTATRPIVADNGSLAQPDLGHGNTAGEGIFFEGSNKCTLVSNSLRTAYWDNNKFFFELGKGSAVTEVSASTYTGQSDEYYYSIQYSATGTHTFTLPAISSTNHGQEYVLKDADYNASSNNITVNTTGSDTIENAASGAMTSDGEAWTLKANNTTKNWELF